MEAAATLRSFHGAFPTTQHAQASLGKSLVASVSSTALKTTSFSRHSVVGQRLTCVSRKGSSLPHTKASETTTALTSDANASDKAAQGPVEKKNVQKSSFPNGFEELISEVCDKTSIAELKLKWNMIRAPLLSRNANRAQNISDGQEGTYKLFLVEVGNFEMHLKREIESSKIPTLVPPIVSPTTPPPIPSEPMVESGPSAQPAVPQKPPPTTTSSPFANILTSKLLKLAALDASGAKGYVIVSSPTVGSFRRGRTLKGKKQPPSCKEGDIIKEGQIIGFLDQFGNELPVRSDVAGEVLKVLYKDGEAVGYGEPLVAVLPSFRGIE